MNDETLEAIAEGDAHARWIVGHHVPQSGPDLERQRCVVCDEWWPCDRVSLAALAVLRARQLAVASQPPS